MADIPFSNFKIQDMTKEIPLSDKNISPSSSMNGKEWEDPFQN